MNDAPPVSTDLLDRHDALMAHLAATGKTVQTLATLPFGREIVAIQTGGDRLPAIVLTAGAHATEVEGTLAALRLIDTLETEHVTYIVPTRDPLGTEGYGATLRRAAGTDEPLNTGETVGALLRRGDVLFDDGALVIAAYGPRAFAHMPRQPDWGPWGHHEIYQRLRRHVQHDPTLGARLNGRNILIPAAAPQIEGCRDFDRAWTAVGAWGDLLHLNRFFGDITAPVEVTAVNRLLDNVQPGLAIDLHAGTSDKFWLPYPLPQQDDALSEAVARAMAAAVRAGGYPTATLAKLRAEGGLANAAFFTPYIDLGNGVTPYYADERGEGSNFMDYCRQFGVAVGTEAGQRAPLAVRTDMIYRAALGGIRAWEAAITDKER